MNILILSDLHLGSSPARGQRLLEQLPRLCRQFDRVILNGDTLDRYDSVGSDPEAERWLAGVREACAGRAGPPEIIAGNHDPGISDLHWVYLARTQTLVFHGDCIADCTHPNKPEEQLLAARLARHWATLGGRPRRFTELARIYRRIQAEHQREHPPTDDERTLWRYVLHSVLPPTKVLHILRYWHSAPRKIAHLAANFDEPVRHVVYGHSHRPGHWVIDGRHVFNTGSCMPISAPFALTIKNTEIRLRRLGSLLRQDIPAPEVPVSNF